jgi:sulfur relay (sulfurtransferase) DsrF/TusC family protein
MRIEFFGCHGSTLLACAICTTFSATAGGKKEVVFLFEDSTV